MYKYLRRSTGENKHGKFILLLNRGGAVGILRNSQVIEHNTWRKNELSHFLSYITYGLTFDGVDTIIDVLTES